MKTALSVIGQLLLFAIFLAIFFAGSFLVLFHLDPLGAPHWFVTQTNGVPTRWFIPSGLILMTILYLIVLGIEAAAKSLRTAGKWTTLAWAAALIIGLIAKFGWVNLT